MKELSLGGRYNQRHGLQGQPEGGRPSGRRSPSARDDPGLVYKTVGGKGLKHWRRAGKCGISRSKNAMEEAIANEGSIYRQNSGAFDLI